MVQRKLQTVKTKKLKTYKTTPKCKKESHQNEKIYNNKNINTTFNYNVHYKSVSLFQRNILA